MASLKVIKLVSGEEIIGTVQDGRDFPPTEDGYSSDDLVFVTCPMKIISTYDQITRAHALYLSDWIPSIGEDTMVISKHQIITLGLPNSEIERHYTEIVMLATMNQASAQEETQEATQLKKMLKNHKFDDDDVQ